MLFIKLNLCLLASTLTICAHLHFLMAFTPTYAFVHIYTHYHYLWLYVSFTTDVIFVLLLKQGVATL